ncbi:MAG TPA: MBL fold metallo-hydrolase [Allosphingosinicella sp.]|nr:MBL fold metallo-hydrolase [Allosphingosinicella sp.]
MHGWAIGILIAGLGLAPAVGRAAQPPAPSAAAVPVAAGPPPAGTYVVHAIDVGTGLSVFVEGHDFTLLYDAGSNDDARRGKDKDRVLAYLRKVRPDMTSLDHVILSHPHKDHVEMMDDVFETYEVRDVWDSGAFNDTCGYRAFLDAVIAEPGVAYHNALGSGGFHEVRVRKSSCHGRKRPATILRVPRASQISNAVVPLGDNASMMILHADGTRKGPSDFNDASVVARLLLGGRSVLLPGDGEAGGRKAPSEIPRPNSAEGKLLACCAIHLRSDILVAGHHGSMTSSRSVFLDAVQASHYVVSAGPKAYSGTVLPDEVVIKEYARRGTVWSTALNDDTCPDNKAKIGPDDDNKPGGCDNVRIVIGRDGSITADYFREAD